MVGSVVVFVAPVDGSAVAVDDPLAVVIAVESTATYSFLPTTILGPVNVHLTAFHQVQVVALDLRLLLQSP